MKVRKRTTSYNEKKDYHTSIQKFGGTSCIYDSCIFADFVQSLYFAPIVLYFISFSSRVSERSYRVTSALFLVVRNVNKTTIGLLGCIFFVAHGFFFWYRGTYRRPQVWGTCGKPSVEGNHCLLGNHYCRRVGTSEVVEN